MNDMDIDFGSATVENEFSNIFGFGKRRGVSRIPKRPSSSGRITSITKNLSPRTTRTTTGRISSLGRKPREPMVTTKDGYRIPMRLIKR